MLLPHTIRTVVRASIHCRSSRRPFGALATALAVIVLTSWTHAQAEAPQAPAAAQEKRAAWVDKDAADGLRYSMKFDGGSVRRLVQLWSGTLSNDNFVVTPSAMGIHLPSFEIRHVRLAELARSIAFLGEGSLTVEVVEPISETNRPTTAIVSGNIWRIGTPPRAEARMVTMRAVAAPHLFVNEEAVRSLAYSAELIREAKLKSIEALSDGKAPRDPRVQLFPLPAQKVVVLIGTESGVAEMESYIQASEQAAAQAAKSSASGK